MLDTPRMEMQMEIKFYTLYYLKVVNNHLWSFPSHMLAAVSEFTSYGRETEDRLVNSWAKNCR